MNHPMQAVRDRLNVVAADVDRRSAEIESARALPRDVVEALVGTGVFRLTVGEELGGFGAAVGPVVDAIEACAYHDGSTAWCVMVGAMAGFDAAHLPPHHAVGIFGDAGAVVGGHHVVFGEARLTEDGGLLVDGRWPWGAGVSQCTWIGGGVRIVDDEGQPSGVKGVEEVFAFFRRDQVVVLDTWHALGLRGAGATDYQVTAAFVPEGRWVPMNPPDDTVGGTIGDDDGRSDERRLHAAARAAIGIGAVALGLARRAVDEVVSAGGEQPDGAQPTLADRPVVQDELARLAVARLGAFDHLRLAVERAETGVDPVAGTSASRAQLLGATLYAVEVAADVVNRCHRLVGMGAVLHASRLQRLLRDVHVITQHPAVSPAGYRSIGQQAFDGCG